MLLFVLPMWYGYGQKLKPSQNTVRLWVSRSAFSRNKRALKGLCKENIMSLGNRLQSTNIWPGMAQSSKNCRWSKEFFHVGYILCKSTKKHVGHISLYYSDHHDILSGWWFQACFIFHFIYGIIHQPLTNFHMFQDGYCTTNQIINRWGYQSMIKFNQY